MSTPARRCNKASRSRALTGSTPSHAHAIGSRHDRGRRELRDRHVIGMPVGAIGPERDDDVRLNATRCSTIAAIAFARVRAIEMLIAIVEKRDFAHAEH